MFSNTRRAVALTLLASAANFAFAAPAPVSDLNSTSSASKSRSSETEVERLERLLQNRNRVQLQMQEQIDQMSQEISDLRGQLERNSYEMQQMLQRQRELFVELDRIRGEMKSAPVKETKPTETSGKYTPNVDEQTAYQNAVDLILKKRDYTGAIAAFQQFQKDYPDSTYSANSHYWLGQLYFAKKQDKDAVKSFAAVVSYKDSNKRADALLKLGEIAERNNNAAQAKKYYQQVVDEYPGSASAKLAGSKLK
ncbi:tol-pal system protein YbgF [Vibrio parahaemolyticus]|uniref:tol-pal system protein YbgF n=1 Tax=Vibrio parahaemolyticus TaxID=670 RepID=UPI000813B98D|nr:tol-pal system protein YbgF [Vibrio parahaemolyticus]MBE4325052.1 tol-pal system protein YbgF [Vibrio parahaemolyticus]MBE5176131.1 tol-pal system protein YbgF [Vibrio parahaemolyticus]OCP56869.1 tol-pal system protein [Vibrio parahaemolyticus]TOI90129.1 tol-pal system protein YbgF [Vibrio parahaemolyticus]TON69567.1 tol-pal system protein YbgF [Vibrio parahaemolyticus]